MAFPNSFLTFPFLSLSIFNYHTLSPSPSKTKPVFESRPTHAMSYETSRSSQLRSVSSPPTFSVPRPYFLIITSLPLPSCPDSAPCFLDSSYNGTVHTRVASEIQGSIPLDQYYDAHCHSNGYLKGHAHILLGLLRIHGSLQFI